MNPTDEQHDAIVDRAGALCVDAGAGSGKTTVLVGRIADILQKEDAKLDEIVAITFTELAARELKGRLRDEFRARGNAAIDDPSMMTFWRKLERRADTARVSTIHGFCSALLRERALHVGLDPDFAVLNETDALLIRERTIVDTVHELLANDDEGALTVAADLGMRTLKVALHDALGKPEAMAEVSAQCDMADADALYDYLYSNHASLIEIALRSYGGSLKALRVLDSLRAFDGECLDAGDFRERKRVAMIKAIMSMRVFSSADVVAQAVAELNAIKGRVVAKNWPNGHAAVSDVQDKAKRFIDGMPSTVWNEEVEREAAKMTSAFYGVYERVCEAYDEAKGARNAIDFNGLIYQAADAIRAGGLSLPIRHLLIDEFQDTDSRQYALAQDLITAFEEHRGALFIVGDKKQSIYGWRGAEVEVFDRARDDTRRDPIYLDKNFRSVPQILSFCNDFFGCTRIIDPYHGLTPSRESLPGPRVEFLMPDVDEKASVGDGRTAEANLLALRIVAWCGGDGVTVEDKSGKRSARFGDIALIMRARSDLAIYEQALRRHGIDYRVESGPGFYTRQEVIDVRNLLAVIVDPWDEPAILAYLRGPIVGLSDDEVYRIAADGGLAQAFNGGEVFDGANTEKLNRARSIVREARERRMDPLPVFIRDLIERTGIESIYLGQQFLSRQRAANIRKVIALAEAFSQTATPTLAGFAQYLDNVSLHEVREGEAAMPESDGGAVRIMTVHQAKGLEFPIVALIDTARGGGGGRRGSSLYLRSDIGMTLRPSDELGEKLPCLVDQAVTAVENKASQEEDARILYVAMTRARDYLVISGAPIGNGWSESWLGRFCETYELERVGDGEVVADRAPVEIRVTRDAPAAHAPQAEVAEIVWPDRETLEAQTGPAPIHHAGPRQMSATDIAKGIVKYRGETVAHEYDDSADQSVARKAMARGTMVHELLELLRPDSDIDALVARIVEAHIELPRERERTADRLRAMVEKLRDMPSMKAILDDENGGREVPFTLAFPGGVVEGVVDVARSDGVIADYKTGQPGDGPAPEYIAQLQLYAYARRQLEGVTPPSAELIFVDTMQTFEVDVSDSAIAKIAEDAAAVLGARTD